MKTHYAMATLAALTLTAGPVLAQPAPGDGDARKMAVSYADLNLGTDAGRAELKARIHHAAELVCGPGPDLKDVKAHMAFERCMKQSVMTAVAAIPSASQMAGKPRPAG